MNSWKADGVTTSPWLHPEALPAIRDALRLRLKLMPYLYSAMRAAHEAHVPVLAPTFVRFEDDPACFADCDALMFGPSLLAAPVTSPGAREVAVYLPRGPERWFDFWTCEAYAPGQTVVLAAPLDRLPLLASAGAIVATTDAGDDYSRLHDEPSRALRIFPGEGRGRSGAGLYQDDGISLEGPVTKVAVTLEWSEAEIRIEAAVSGDYELPYRRFRVVSPEAETRELRRANIGGRVALTL
jgi:alpha-glucosidase